MNETVYLGQSDGVSKRLGHLFRVNRKAKKMSVRVLSELTGIHPGAIIKFELGKTDMTVSRVFKIITVVRCVYSTATSSLEPA